MARFNLTACHCEFLFVVGVRIFFRFHTLARHVEFKLNCWIIIYWYVTVPWKFFNFPQKNHSKGDKVPCMRCQGLDRLLRTKEMLKKEHKRRITGSCMEPNLLFFTLNWPEELNYRRKIELVRRFLRTMVPVVKRWQSGSNWTLELLSAIFFLRGNNIVCT